MRHRKKQGSMEQIQEKKIETHPEEAHNLY